MACGLDIVLRAAKILRDKERDNLKFLLVGDGAAKDQLQQQAVTERLDNIVFVGRQDKKAIPSILSSVDSCLVHLRKTELFKTVLPSKIFEAAAMAKPIVIGVAGCAADLVKSAKAGICIEPENAEQLVAALERLADDRRLCGEFGKAGCEYVVKHYDRDKLALDYLDAITRVCSDQ
jgi:glycosyltransferase involved in cell wall biosynthesis